MVYSDNASDFLSDIHFGMFLNFRPQGKDIKGRLRVYIHFPAFKNSTSIGSIHSPFQYPFFIRHKNYYSEY